MENKRVSAIQEMRICKSLKEIQEQARCTVGSGNKWTDKSDVVTEQFRIECKTKATKSKSITLQKEWFDKISMEAFETNKIPLLAFSFGDRQDYFTLESEHFIALVNELQELRKTNIQEERVD